MINSTLVELLKSITKNILMFINLLFNNIICFFPLSVTCPEFLVKLANISGTLLPTWCWGDKYSSPVGNNWPNRKLVISSSMRHCVWRLVVDGFFNCMWGPVEKRLLNWMLEPVVDRFFNYMWPLVVDRFFNCMWGSPQEEWMMMMRGADPGQVPSLERKQTISQPPPSRAKMSQTALSPDLTPQGSRWRTDQGNRNWRYWSSCFSAVSACWCEGQIHTDWRKSNNGEKLKCTLNIIIAI